MNISNNINNNSNNNNISNNYNNSLSMGLGLSPLPAPATATSHNNPPPPPHPPPHPHANTSANTNINMNSSSSSSTSFSSSPSAKNVVASDPSQRPCYCGDLSLKATDLICSIDGPDCFVTHVDCLRYNSGYKFHDYVLLRSVFLCANCVRKKTFVHPKDYACTLDSQFGCFYEKFEDVVLDVDKKTVLRVKMPSSQPMSHSSTSTNAATVATKSSEKGSKIKTKASAAPRIQVHDIEAKEKASSSSSSSSSPASSPTESNDDNTNTSTSPELTGNKRKRRAIRDSDRKDASAAASSSSSAPVNFTTLNSIKAVKTRPIPRCTSPSHFYSEGDESSLAALALPPTFQLYQQLALPPVRDLASYSSSSSANDASTSSSSHLNPVTMLANPRLVDKVRADSILAAVSSLYYRPRVPFNANNNVAASNASSSSASYNSSSSSSPFASSNAANASSAARHVLVSTEYDRLEYSTLDLLISPLRQPSVLDNWTPFEIALFEAGICAHGKDFHAIAKLMSDASNQASMNDTSKRKAKTTNDCVEFYYAWKKSAHYSLWKDCGKPVKKRNENRQQQWLKIKEKFAGALTSSKKEEKSTTSNTASDLAATTNNVLKREAEDNNREDEQQRKRRKTEGAHEDGEKVAT